MEIPIKFKNRPLMPDFIKHLGCIQKTHWLTAQFCRNAILVKDNVLVAICGKHHMLARIQL